MGPDFREDCVLFQDGLSTRVRMFKSFYADQHSQAAMASLQSKHGTDIIRAPRPEAPPPEVEPEEEPESTGAAITVSQQKKGPDGKDDDLSGDPEYQRRLAELQAEMRSRKPETSPSPPENGAELPESHTESSKKKKRPPMPPNFDE